MFICQLTKGNAFLRSPIPYRLMASTGTICIGNPRRYMPDNPMLVQPSVRAPPAWSKDYVLVMLLPEQIHQPGFIGILHDAMLHLQIDPPQHLLPIHINLPLHRAIRLEQQAAPVPDPKLPPLRNLPGIAKHGHIFFPIRMILYCG